MQNLMGKAREAVTDAVHKADQMLQGHKQGAQQGQTTGQPAQQAAGGAPGTTTTGTKAININDLIIKQDAGRNRFSCMLDGEEAYLDYKLNRENNTIEITYLYVPQAYRDQGVASKLLTEVHNWAKGSNLTCSPSSEARPFVEKWLVEHPQYKGTCKC